ncbi:MAG: ATP-binding cassette domain-containing protein [Bacilli bacterium]
MSKNVFEVDNLNLSFKDGVAKRKIFDGAKASFESEKVYAIMGRSGSGKSSFISIISGLIQADESTIKYNDIEISPKDMTEFRKENIALIFQDYNLIEYLSPIQNINLATSIQLNEKLESGFVSYLLELVEISEVNAKKNVAKLSGGEKQRVAIARALSTDSPILLADEPTGNLDEENEKNIIKLFKKIAKESNKIVVIVTHSPEIAKQCDEVYMIEGCEFVSGTL